MRSILACWRLYAETACVACSFCLPFLPRLLLLLVVVLLLTIFPLFLPSLCVASSSRSPLQL